MVCTHICGFSAYADTCMSAYTKRISMKKAHMHVASLETEGEQKETGNAELCDDMR